MVPGDKVVQHVSLEIPISKLIENANKNKAPQVIKNTTLDKVVSNTTRK